MKTVKITLTDKLYNRIIETAKAEAAGCKRELDVSATASILLYEAIKSRVLCKEAKISYEYLRGERP